MPYAAALSTAWDTQQAAAEACDQARGRLDADPDLAVVFFSPHHREAGVALAATLAGRLRAKCLIGTVAESVVGNGREVERGPALSVWVGHFGGRVNVEPFRLEPARTSEGLELLGWPDGLIQADPAKSALLTLGDPFTFPVAEIFLPRVNQDYAGLPVMGGMASGVNAPGETTLILNEEPIDLGAVGVLLTGEPCWRSLVSQGCRPVGKPMVVTKGSEMMILELGGRPPLEHLHELYEALPAREQELMQTNLHIGMVMSEYKDSFGRGDFLIRNIHGVNTDLGAVMIADRVRVGQTVQFQLRDAEAADEDLRELLRRDREAHGPAASSLLFTCNGRGTRMFPSPDHDAGAVREELGALPVAGMFAGGELGPVGGVNYIHGFTASLVLFSEPGV